MAVVEVVVMMMMMMMMIFKEKLPVFQKKKSRIISHFHTVQCLLRSHSAALQDSPTK